MNKATSRRPISAGATFGVFHTEQKSTARSAGVLQKQQEHIARQAEILVRGFAGIGIIALIDEATGYQRDR
jgi:hypothetical protein